MSGEKKLGSMWLRARTMARILVRCLPLLWKASPVYTTGVVLAILLQGVLPAIGVWISKPLVDKAVGVAIGTGVQPREVGLLAGVWLLAVLIGSALTPVIGALQGLLTDKLTAHINLEVMKKASGLPDLSVFETPSFYDDLQVIQQEAAWRPVNLIVFSIGAVRAILSALTMLVLLGQFHPFIPIVVCLTAIPHAFISFRLQNDAFEVLVWKSPEARKMQYYSSVLLTDSYAKEVRIHGLGDLFTALYRGAFDRVHQATSGVRWRQVHWSVVLAILSVAGSGLSFWWVISQAMEGRVTAGGLMLFTQAVLMAQQGLSSMIENSSMLYETILFMQKLFQFLDFRSPLRVLPPDQAAKVPVPIKQGVEFRNVRFDYPGGRRALQGVDLRIGPGQVVALVGENGAGKTTVVKLLARLYDPADGQILVDSRDLREYDLAMWRRNVAVVFQDFAKYQLTAATNVAIGAVEAVEDRKRIEDAARLSGAATVIDHLPHGYDTMLGKQFDGGVDLSGGEWQKIALARAFIRDAQLLILDEPTAALDPRSEFEVYQRFAELVRGKSVLLISHRLSAVRMADRILVMDDGRIVEQGTHEELMRMRGLYAEMYEMQASRYQDDNLAEAIGND